MSLFNLFNKKKHVAPEPEPEPTPGVHYEKLALLSPGFSHRTEITEPWYLAKRKTSELEVVCVTTPTESKLVIMPKYKVDEKSKQAFDEDLESFIMEAFNGRVPQSLDDIERLYKKNMRVPAKLVRY
jgi:hypothetical protein